MKTKFCLFGLALAFFSLSSPGRAATRTWDGSASGFWTNAANWSGGLAPANGDALLFPFGITRVATTNSSGAPANFSRLDFSGSNYIVFGPTLTLTNGITNAISLFSSNTLNCPMRVGANQTWTNTSRAVLVVNANVDLNARTLTFGSLGIFDINGALTNNGNVVKLGSGELNLNGTNTFLGTLTLEGGPLRVDGSITAASLALNGGRLEGTGSVHGFIASSGSTVAPGDEFTPGKMLSTGNVKFDAGATFDVDVNGTVAGTEHDQLVVAGTVDLGGATLARVFGAVVAPGQKFRIIDNDGTDPVTNTFANLPEGALLTNGASVLQITYLGGTGNDVELIGLGFATRTWSGLGTNALWSNPSNWVDNIAPLPHDELVFPESAAQPVSTNDLSSGTLFVAITLSGSNYVLSGNALTLQDGITNNPASGTNSIRCAIALSQTNTPVVVGTNASLVLSGALTGSGGLAKLGTGSLTLAGTDENSYSGTTTVAPGLLLLNKSAGTNAIPGSLVVTGTVRLLQSNQISDTSPITLNLGGTLDFNSKSDAVGPLTLNAGLITTLFGTLFMNGDVIVNGDAAISGNVELGSVTRALNFSNSTASLIVGAQIHGAGGLVKNGGGQLTLGNSNSFAGRLTVNAGTLKIDHPFALGDTNGETVIQGNANITLVDRIGFEPLILDSTGDPLANFGGVIAVPGGPLSESWAGNIVLEQNTTINVGSGAALLLSGNISGSGALIKTGLGRLTLSGNNSYTGDTRANAGTLLINGPQPLSAVTANNAILGGTGIVSTVVITNGAMLSPGASPGILSSSNVTFFPSGRFVVELNGTNAGIDYDQLNVTGSVAVAGLLTGSVGFTPGLGDTFTLIDNDGSEPVDGTFQGLPEGSVLGLGGFAFQISYQGGSGSNDVVLTRVTGPPSQLTSIKLTTNGFEQLQGLGLSNLNFLIQANSNLLTTNWSIIGTALANGSGIFTFTDTNAPLFPMRFYRVLSP